MKHIITQAHSLDSYKKEYWWKKKKKYYDLIDGTLAKWIDIGRFSFLLYFLIDCLSVNVFHPLHLQSSVDQKTSANQRSQAPPPEAVPWFLAVLSGHGLCCGGLRWSQHPTEQCPFWLFHCAMLAALHSTAPLIWCFYIYLRIVYTLKCLITLLNSEVFKYSSYTPCRASAKNRTLRSFCYCWLSIEKNHRISIW